jgi:hypothetical protein
VKQHREEREARPDSTSDRLDRARAVGCALADPERERYKRREGEGAERKGRKGERQQQPREDGKERRSH